MSKGAVYMGIVRMLPDGKYMADVYPILASAGVVWLGDFCHAVGLGRRSARISRWAEEGWLRLADVPRPGWRTIASQTVVSAGIRCIRLGLPVVRLTPQVAAHVATCALYRHELGDSCRAWYGEQILKHTRRDLLHDVCGGWAPDGLAVIGAGETMRCEAVEALGTQIAGLETERSEKLAHWRGTSRFSGVTWLEVETGVGARKSPKPYSYLGRDELAV